MVAVQGRSRFRDGRGSKKVGLQRRLEVRVVRVQGRSGFSEGGLVGGRKKCMFFHTRWSL